MCRVVSRELASATSAAGDARRFVAETLLRWELDALVGDALLLVSELVTNAVLHARTAVTVTVAVADGVAEIGVADRSPALPRQRGRSAERLPRPGAGSPAGGRGLYLVDQVAQEWGIASGPDGKQVWFRLDVGPDWPHRTGCPCGGADLDRVRLESGRYAVAAPGPWDVP